MKKIIWLLAFLSFNAYGAESSMVKATIADIKVPVH
jgi:hypothetical protein